MRARRLRFAACAATLALGLTACGSSGNNPSHAGGQNSGNNSADANNNGGYVDAGPVTYQLQISRELNQYSSEDSSYLKGVAAGDQSLSAQQEWFGVFLWAKNQTHHDQTTLNNFEIQDTQGHTYYPVKIDPSANPFAWTAQTLRPNETEPAPNTVPSSGPTQGDELLFKVSTNVYDNRPLTLLILGADNKKLGTISLNL